MRAGLHQVYNDGDLKRDELALKAAAAHPQSEKRPLVTIIYAALATCLFLASLLVLFSAPLGWLWILSILVGEWGHFIAPGCLAIAMLAWRRGRIGQVASVVGLIAAVLFAYPAVAASIIARSLPDRCDAAFGTARVDRPPFSFLTLFIGAATPELVVSEHAYAMKGTKPLLLDLYRSRNATAPLPVIVFVHGGSWRAGNKAQLSAFNRQLARQGCAVAAINYRKAPKWHFPAAVDDVFRAIDFLKANAAELQIDPTRIVLAGRSAGGQIALSAAYSGRDPAIRGVIAFYPPTDLLLGYQIPSRPGVLNSREALEDFLGGSPAEKPLAYTAASPLAHVTPNTPPTLLIHGRRDPVVWPFHSEMLDRRLAELQRPHLLLMLPWATHGCDANPNGPSGQLSLYTIERFLRSGILENR